MEQYKIHFNNIAESELRAIYSFIAKQSFAPMAASKLVKTIKSESNKLSYMAKGYPIAYKKLKYRKMIVKNYLIFYSVNEKEKTVFIERIMHGRRDWKKRLRKSK